MITEKNHKLLTSQIFLTDCTKKGLASMHTSEMILVKYVKIKSDLYLYPCKCYFKILVKSDVRNLR